MSVNINAASARIDVSAQQAIPGVDIRSKSVLFHLTKGLIPGGGISGQAFTADGRVKVAVGSGDTLNGFDFGFIQLSRVNFFGIFYAGRIRSEGSIGILVHVPPALPNALLLDSDANFTPFTAPQPRFQFSAGEVKSTTGDHPANFVGRELRNSITNIKNFLFQVVDSREFWSVFTAIDRQGKTQHLAHFHWSLRHDVKFSWLGGNPIVSTTQSSFKILRNEKGAPKEPELQSLLTNPIGPQFNVVSQAALLQATLGARGPNRSENPQWFNNVPNNFFQ